MKETVTFGETTNFDDFKEVMKEVEVSKSQLLDVGLIRGFKPERLVAHTTDYLERAFRAHFDRGGGVQYYLLARQVHPGMPAGAPECMLERRATFSGYAAFDLFCDYVRDGPAWTARARHRLDEAQLVEALHHFEKRATETYGRGGWQWKKCVTKLVTKCAEDV